MAKLTEGKKPPFRISPRRIAIAGIFTAMTVVATVFTRIPFPMILGYFNLGDAVVLIAGAQFGGLTGAFAGAVGSAAADLFTGGYIFAPVTFIVKGAEGFIAGTLARGSKRGLTIALVLGAAFMVAGYFAAEATILAALDRAFGIGAAIAELPINVAQGVLSVALARVAIEGFRRSGVF